MSFRHNWAKINLYRPDTRFAVQIAFNCHTKADTPDSSLCSTKVHSDIRRIKIYLVHPKCFITNLKVVKEQFLTFLCTEQGISLDDSSEICWKNASAATKLKLPLAYVHFPKLFPFALIYMANPIIVLQQMSKTPNSSYCWYSDPSL